MPDQVILGCTAIIQSGNEATDPIAAAHYNRGFAYQLKRDFDRAIADFDQVIALNPNIAMAFNNRGLIYFDKRDYNKAIADFDQAIAIDSHVVFFFNNRGNAYRNSKQFDQALADYERAVEIDSKFVPVLNNLAFALATLPLAELRNGPRAVELAERLVSLTAGNPSYLDTLAAAYAEAERFDDAVRTQEGAIKLLRQAGATQAISKFETRLRLYKNRQPYRE